VTRREFIAGAGVLLAGGLFSRGDAETRSRSNSLCVSAPLREKHLRLGVQSPCKGRSLCELENFRFCQEAHPCRDVVFKPLDGGTMLYGDDVRKLDGQPFAKDPSVIRHGGRYLMYYSACGMDEQTLPGDVPGARMGKWCCAIAESTDLVNWRRIGDVVVDGAPFEDGWMAPGVRKIDGQIHLFAQNPVPGAKMVDPFMNQAIWHATSDDGIHFKRWSDKPVLPHGTEGSWNAWESGHPGVFKDDDGQIYLFYQGKATLDGTYRLSCLKVEFVE